MTDQTAEQRMAEVIWRTSRADEGTISATGANHVAAALVAAGFGDVRQAGAEGARIALYETGWWCGECNPADPGENCCSIPERVRARLREEER